MSKSIVQVGDFRPGMKKLRAEDLNAILDICKRPGGLDASVADSAESWLGIIDASGKTDYTDERYWVRRAYCNLETGDQDAQITIASFVDATRFPQVTATNLAELAAHTHSLADGEVVRVYVVHDVQSSQAVPHYYFRAAVGGVLFGTLDANFSSGESADVTPLGTSETHTVKMSRDGAAATCYGSTVVPAGKIIAYTAHAGAYYVLSVPENRMYDFKVEPADGLYVRYQTQWGQFAAEPSDWEQVAEFFTCFTT